jgi:outer membrane murein-binding lipoprotein Lpp
MAALIAGVVVFVALFSIGGANKARIERKKTEFADLEAELQRVRQSADKVRELEAKQASIAAKNDAIEQITSDRIVWSEQLYYLAKLLPNDTWLKDIEVEHKTRKKTVPIPDAKEGEPTTKQIVVPYQSLKLIGYAMSYKDEMGVNLVGVLVRAIEDDTSFGVHFRNPEPRLVKDEDFGGVSVKEFEVNCEIFAVKNKGPANP